MEPVHEASKCMLEFVFSAPPLVTSAVSPTYYPKAHGAPVLGALTPCSPSADGLSFNVGALEADTTRRSAGRTYGSGTSGHRHGLLHRRLSPAAGLKLYPATATHGATAVPPFRIVVTPAPPSPQPNAEGSARAPFAFGPLFSTPPPPPDETLGVDELSGGACQDVAAGAADRRPTGWSDEPDVAAAPEDAGVSALDQLISLLLLPDDDPEVEGMGVPGEDELHAAATVAMEPAVGALGGGRRGSAPGHGAGENEGCAVLGTVGSDDNAGGGGGAAGAGSAGVPAGDSMSATQQPDDGVPAFRSAGHDAATGVSWPPGSGLARQAGPQPPGGGCASANDDGMSDDELLGLQALAAALDEVDAAVKWPGESPPALLLQPDVFASTPSSDGEEEQEGRAGQSGWLPPGLLGMGRPGTAPWAQAAGPSQQRLPVTARRLRRVVKRATATAASACAAGQRAEVGDRQQGGTRGEDAGCWKVVLSAPEPHNPEALATLLLAGRLVNPHTAVPAPLLAAAAREHQKQQQQQGGPSAALNHRGPAVAVVRCASEHDAVAALALNSRRLFAPSLARSGADTWRQLTVVLQSWPGAAHEGSGMSPPPPQLANPAASPAQGTRTRDVGPRVRRAVLSGLPGHLDRDDVISLFGNGLQLPGHCPTPQHRRFLILCPDAAAFNALVEWSGTLLPEKPLDALQQIVPRVASWSTVRVEEDDGIQLPALMSQLMASARLSGSAAAPDSAAATAAARRQQQYPRVAGRFHPAELDEMDEMEARAADLMGGTADLAARLGALGISESSAPAAAVRADSGGGAGSSGGQRPAPAPAAAAAAASPAGPRSAEGRLRRPTAGLDVGEDRMRVDAPSLYSSDDAAAAAERAESSRGASSSGLAARPAPRLRRTAAAGAGGQYAASAGAAGAFFGHGAGVAGIGVSPVAAVPRCECCPLPPSGGRGAASGDMGPTSWSGQAAVELLNKLMALGIEPPGPSQAGGDGGVPGEEGERAPFFRRSRKRMSAHFGRRPEDEEEAEAEEEGGGDGGAAPVEQSSAAVVAAVAGDTSRAAAATAESPREGGALRNAAVEEGERGAGSDEGGGLDDPS